MRIHTCVITHGRAFFKALRAGLFFAAVAISLNGCTGGDGFSQPDNAHPSNFSVGGTVSGLATAQQVVLVNNGDTTHAVTITQNGGFTFPVKVAVGSAYNVTISQPPTGQACTVTNGAASSINANVSNVQVVCQPQTAYVLYSFTGGLDSGYPTANLTLGSDGNFYGVSNPTGRTSYGSIFKITPSGTFTVLHSQVLSTPFPEGTDGLVEYSPGLFYGVARLGGAANLGILYSITSAGQYTQVYSFGSLASPRDGANQPNGPLVIKNGLLYGTSSTGGSQSYGTIFSFDPKTNTETVLYSFQSLPDGQNPTSGLTLATDGNFYGLTTAGGVGMAPFGTVFQFNPTTAIETTLYTFLTGGDPQNFNCTLLEATDGKLYGVAPFDGAQLEGSLFSMTMPTSSISPTSTYTLLHSFGSSATDGQLPVGSLMQGFDGNIYGVSNTGGVNGFGSIFQFNLGIQAIATVYSFGATPGYAYPASGLVQDSNGFLYGTSVGDGAYGYGTVYRY